MYQLVRALASRTREHWHDSRAHLFARVMQPWPGARVLDLGGNDGEFMARLVTDMPLDVTVADMDAAALDRARARGFSTVLLDGTPQLPFTDVEFDIVFCNSVIEHVTLPKRDCVEKTFTDAAWVSASLQSQREFAREVARVGRGYFVQTPHRAFPVEAHTWLPFVGWLPHDPTVRIVRLTDRFWVKRCGYVDWHLLDGRTMQQLFPAARLHTERVLGVPKSLIAYRPAGAPRAV